LSRGDLTDSEWRILDPLLPNRGERGPGHCRQAANGQRHYLGTAHRRALARYARTVRQLEFGLRTLHALEQAGRVGCGVRNAGESGPSRRQGTCHRFHDRAGAPTCGRRKRGNQAREALGRSRGGFSTKIHLRTNATKGDPLTFDVTGGEAHEVKGYDTLMKLHDVDPDRLLGDKGYDSDEIRDDLVGRGIEAVIPPRSNRKTQIEYDREAYKRRNLIERCVNRLKQFRRIATRYEKTARAYLSMLCIAAARLWIKTVNTA
jgi:transposase